MDLQTVTLVAQTAVAAVTAFLAKAGEAGSKKAGEDVYGWLKSHLPTKATSSEALHELEKAPSDSDLQEALRAELHKLIESNPEFAGKLDQMTAALRGPAQSVTVKMHAGNDSVQIGTSSGTIVINKK
jgi:hypothetical protein